MEDAGLFSKYMMHELLDELDVIECFTQPGKAPVQGEVLKKQEQKYRDFGYGVFAVRENLRKTTEDQIVLLI